MNRKLLFIAFSNLQAYTGGAHAMILDLKIIQEVFGHENVVPYIIEPVQVKRSFADKVTRFKEILCGYFGGLTQHHLNSILSIVKKKHITDVFIDSSQLGLVAQKIHLLFPNVKIYCFFQNIEYDFIRSQVFDAKDYKHFFQVFLAKHNETSACKYCDKVIVLNSRDGNRLRAVYHRVPDFFRPVWLEDEKLPPMNTDKYVDYDKPLNALFVGSYFFGNVVGLKKFCQNVLPHTNINLQIVGSGMQALIDELGEMKQISIAHDVPDLTPYYENADFIVLPITTGGGMKVKTAEALKYGKFIIGTPEALEGYEVNEDVACVCKTTDEFINAINSYNKQKKFNLPSRSLFKSRYSKEASIHIYQNLLFPNENNH
ncbi:MAG: glycosyltransferase [Prevotella sp.]|jgi:hypothetical protein